MGSYHPTWGVFNQVLYPALGNHEYYTDDAAGYFRYMREQGVMDRLPGSADDPRRGYFAVDLNERWRLVVVNSVCDEVAGGCAEGSPQLDWLTAELSAAADRCTMVAMHDPRFNTGHHGDDEELSDLFAAAYEHGADLMLTGHEHRYERFAPLDPDGERDDARGVTLVIVGTGGSSLYLTDEEPHPASRARFMDSYGVLRLVLHEDRAELTYHAAEGYPGEDRATVRCR
jgi:3',5'-cyclic AMP phosphodiesterase CpdA